MATQKRQRDAPELAKFALLAKVGLNQGAVEERMLAAGMVPAALFGDAAMSPIGAAAGPDSVVVDGLLVPPRGSPALDKYERMARQGIPQGAVETSMLNDGVHPGALFEQPLTSASAIRMRALR